ncbi:vitamin K epoxide reductase family protein [Corynebacterium sp. HMSC28B08]|uniref:vitamin K epoxide reductase family protein n=1 Tax=Corynebacterium sp. HMSC28B08 TaxID=1581066 RepID=UPI0008A322A7|nr:vitamin K epoxide reductase family protein [Corynebacterium sp. HMSC28B08]
MTETPAAAVATTTAPTASSAPATTLDRSARGLPASRGFAILMLVLAAIGLWFSTLIMYDKIKLVLDSSFTPACTLNDVVSCSDVMASSQASAFGFPNPFIGMIGFPVVMTIAVVLLVGARLPRWLWWSVVVGLGLAVVFVHWLAFQAIFNIVALCPWCMVVWSVTLPLFVMSLTHTVRQSRRQRGQPTAEGIGVPLAITLVWYVGFAAVIAMQFLM